MKDDNLDLILPGAMLCWPNEFLGFAGEFLRSAPSCIETGTVPFLREEQQQ